MAAEPQPQPLCEFVARQDPRRSTLRWHVLNRRNFLKKELLGLVVWSPPWQRYVFAPESGALLSSAHLVEIARFCAAQSRVQREVASRQAGGVRRG